MDLYNEDCIIGSSKIKDKSVDLLICDPPFGINEVQFEKLYNRQSSNVINGYVQAPTDYYDFTVKWLQQAVRVLKDDGTIYIFSGWNNLCDVLNAVRKLDLVQQNHLIWKYNFGVFATKKFISSHYHILKVKKNNNKKTKFNTNCRFGRNQKDNNNKSLLNKDLQDVFIINKQYSKGQKKNQNKLPNSLIEKLVLYSSSKDDTVCDFFMGNFTTAYVAHGLGRKVIGFQVNKQSYDYHKPILQSMTFGSDLGKLKIVDQSKPQNAGKKISDQDRQDIIQQYQQLTKTLTKKQAIQQICNTFQRGKFAIKNIIKDGV